VISWVQKVILRSCSTGTSHKRLSTPCIFVGQDIKHFYEEAQFEPIIALAIISKKHASDCEFVLANNIAHVFYDEIDVYLSVVMIRECFKLFETRMTLCLRHYSPRFTNFIGYQFSNELSSEGGRLVYLVSEDVFFEDRSVKDLVESNTDEKVVVTSQSHSFQAA